MSTQLIKPTQPQQLDIRCNVGDAIVANFAVHIVFFFERCLDTNVLRRAFERALINLPIFAGRLAMADGTMRIRCRGQGVPFTSKSSGRTLREAIRSVSEDSGRWLVDQVNVATARLGRGPLCTVRVTQLADAATAIGLSWHHSVGDMHTVMHLMNAWADAAADKPLTEPLIVENRASYLDEHLPAGGASEPGVRFLGLTETARSALYMAKDARKQRTLSIYFGEDEITRMRHAYGTRMRLSVNDVVCGHLSEAIMQADPALDQRTLMIAVNARKRCGLDPMLLGNIITPLNIDLQRGDAANSIAERIRCKVDDFTQLCDIRINQRFLDAAGGWRAARCVTRAFNPVHWNPLVTNWSGFGLYDIRFEDTRPSYCTPLMRLPIAGGCVVIEGAGGRGVVLHTALPPKDYEAMSSPEIREYIHQFRSAGDDIPRLHPVAGAIDRRD
ncbi:hypothetical protein [Kitasatospora setae KM-6054] [Mycobacterium shimoidei]|uniref:Uncharacterized protein n=1 Tax=Mycobacterium shimoidei TaxID=29313 RepID=A0A375Z4T2_MYCSH|nr:acyltransferase [Mycobacterium shimoidei]SRX96153.1 hypothetical protein [Kitasatospora setae KM-6054] [Mycobacterium shimoidei]